MSENARLHVSLRMNPLVPAAVLFLLGVVLGRAYPIGLPAALAVAGLACVGWWMSDRLFRGMPAIVSAGILGVGIAATGAGAWALNQENVERTHLVRMVPAREETPVTLRMVVLEPPDAASHVDQFFFARATEVLSTTGWRAASGDVLVTWRAGEGGAVLRPGGRIEVYGWASRPLGAMNPGGIDQRGRLGAERVFVQVRVPRANGIVALDDGGRSRVGMLEAARVYLRGKFLGHLLDEDVPAAYALTALLLGYRDPAASDVSQAFADAGVAHLLAISGSHIVFFAAMAWWGLMLIPMRPRQRELLIAGIVGLYVLATPCGPPIIRAAVALAMLVISRMAGRPAQYLNMRAAAAIVIVLWRPADIGDAGFQLSFVSTAGLILFAERLYRGLFGAYLERQSLIAELAATRWARRKLWAKKWVCGGIVANFIGAVTAAPLVAYHFGQVNLWAVVAGIIALPVVSLAMGFAALQLVAEFAGLGAVLAMPTLYAGKLMIWVVQVLAALPGAAVAVRSPPWYLVAILYVAMLLAIVRKRLGVSRAQAVNCCVGSVVIAVGWYALSAPVGALDVTVLSVGQTSSVLVRAPGGGLWAIDAAAPRGSSPTNILGNGMRNSGERRLAGLVLTHLDAPHASSAAEVLERFRPAHVFVSEVDWRHRTETLAGASIDAVASIQQTQVTSLHAGQQLVLGRGATLEILWPPNDAEPLDHPNLIARLSYGARHILIVDPHGQRAIAALMLADPALRADVVIFTNQERGAADEGLRKLIEPLKARNILWASRGSWAPRTSASGERNAAEGAISLRVTASGEIIFPPSP